MSQTTVPLFVNRAMKSILRSPLHGLVSKTVLLITFTGRKSNKTYTTPVSYSQFNDYLFIFTHAAWWKNLRSDMPVTLRLRGRDFQGLAEAVVDDKQTIAAGLSAHLQKVPFDARYYSVTLDSRGIPREGDVKKAVQSVTMIRVKLC